MKSLLLRAAKRYEQLSNQVLNQFSPPIIVLMYHRVSDLGAGSGYTVSTANFQNQMRYIKQHFKILRFEDDWRNIDRPSCVITFDDGYFDNYIIARDFLEQEAIPATFFITTQNIETNNLFWWDKLFLNQDFFERQTGKTIHNLARRLKNSKPSQQVAFFDRYRALNTAAKERLVSNYRSMSQEELIKLSQLKQTTIGAHTVNHPKLTLLTCEEMLFELSESKTTLERITGSPVTTCSFPYGSYNEETIAICNDIEFQKGAATGFSRNAYGWTNPFKIPRISVDDEPIDVFSQKIQQLLN